MARGSASAMPIRKKERSFLFAGLLPSTSKDSTTKTGTNHLGLFLPEHTPQALIRLDRDGCLFAVFGASYRIEISVILRHL
jgi:hypothetical protein